ncbi:MAG: hypothetical protein FJX57_20515 [Alphaproteobacteria bacterium]|nr:hypothetical protein [Alphaproteobacteria bacterium]
MVMRRLALITTLAAATLASTVAGAVVQTSGDILISGTHAEVDLLFFSVGGVGIQATGIQADPRAPAGPPGVLTTEDMGLLLYTEVGGAIGALLGSAGAPGGAQNARIDINLAPGDYIAVVSWSTLAHGEFGPTQNDPNVSIKIEEYELSLDGVGGNNSVFTCAIEGQLGGTYTVTKFDPAADCVVPTSTAVPAPGGLALLLSGIAAAGLGLSRRGARTAVRSRC